MKKKIQSKSIDTIRLSIDKNGKSEVRTTSNPDTPELELERINEAFINEEEYDILK